MYKYQIYVNDKPIGKPVNFEDMGYWLNRITKLLPDCDVYAYIVS